MITLRLIFGKARSDCCKAKTLLVRSRRGGYSTQNCLHCGKPAPLPISNLPKINCDTCGNELLIRQFLPEGYRYECSNCKREWLLKDILPHWSDDLEFPDHGIAAPGDYPL